MTKSNGIGEERSMLDASEKKDTWNCRSVARWSPVERNSQQPVDPPLHPTTTTLPPTGLSPGDDVQSMKTKGFCDRLSFHFLDILWCATT